jgi:hypothetical protein
MLSNISTIQTFNIQTISKRVKQLLPETYSAAEGYAFQIECENLSSQAKKNEFLNSF